MVEVVSGLEAGDRIVIDGTGKLRAGVKVDASVEAATRPAEPKPAAEPKSPPDPEPTTAAQPAG